MFAGLRYELIEGDLIDKMGQKPLHSLGLRLASFALIAKYGVRNVRVQQPMEVAGPDRTWSFPEPDLVVAIDDGRFNNRNPQGDETVQVVEVADTTLRHDGATKRDLYARANVPEYWVLDVKGRQLLVYEQPIAGAYTIRRTLSETDSIHDMPVADMLPPKEPKE